MRSGTMHELKLIALDQEDLGILSAHLQDAVLKVEDLAYLPDQKRFAALANRFDWSAALADGTTPGKSNYTRHRSALRFERVTAARLRGIDLQNKAQVLSMLALQFEPTSSDDPSGTITLIFAGDAAIQLSVEYIEAEFRDLGGVWSAKSRPQHPGTGQENSGDG